MRQLDEWLASPAVPAFPYASVIDQYWKVGKHFVDAGLLGRLAKARAQLPGLDAGRDESLRLSRFLDVALDKFDGTYDYRSYLALPLLPLPYDEPCTGDAAVALSRRDRLLVALVGDLLRFELAAVHGEDAPLPDMRASREVASKRCRLGLLALEPVLRRRMQALQPTRVHDDDPLTGAAVLCSLLGAQQTPADRELMRLTMLPVFTIHDEYFFLRVLQSFETQFACMCSLLEAAIASVDRGDAVQAALLVSWCQATLQESAPLFSLLATMQVEAFRTFRQYTEGASAIQSRSYKTMESLCSRPREERLGSAAYLSVPEVRGQVLDDRPTLMAAYLRAERSRAAPDDALQMLRAAMMSLEERVLLWRKTHHGLAVRMLGAGTGTGYTAGTPYLQSVAKLPLFNDWAAA